MSECEMLPNIVNSVGLVFDILGVVILFFTVSVQGRSGGAGAAGSGRRRHGWGPSWSARAPGSGRLVCARRPPLTARGPSPCLAVP